MPRLRSPPRSHCVRKKVSYLAIKYESDSRRSSFSDSASDTKSSPRMKKEALLDVKAGTHSPYDVKLERPATPSLLGTKRGIKANFEPACFIKSEEKPKIKNEKPKIELEESIKVENKAGYEPDSDVKCFGLDSEAHLIETYEPVSSRNKHFEGPWPIIEKEMHTAHWNRISRLIISTPDLYIPVNVRLELPRCTSFHLNTCHPADLLSFELPMVQYLGLTTPDIHDSTYADEVESLFESKSVGKLRPTQLFMALPIDDSNYSTLLHIVGTTAVTVKVTLGPESYMGHLLFDSLQAPSQYPGKYTSPKLLPRARHVLFDLKNCAGYSQLACESAEEILRGAAELRSEWASERVTMRLV